MKVLTLHWVSSDLSPSLHLTSLLLYGGESLDSPDDLHQHYRARSLLWPRRAESAGALPGLLSTSLQPVNAGGGQPGSSSGLCCGSRPQFLFWCLIRVGQLLSKRYFGLFFLAKCPFPASMAWESKPLLGLLWSMTICISKFLASSTSRLRHEKMKT